MELRFEMSLAARYHSATQRARVLTENWVVTNMYCPRCGNSQVEHLKNNMPVADFFCPHCGNQYELKSKNGRLGRKVADGAYGTMIERITGNNNPDFFFMSYSMPEGVVRDFLMIPKQFFVPGIIERRTPLGPNARRAGWEGCNILLDGVPSQGRISIIEDGIPVEKANVLDKTARSYLLETGDLAARGWLMDVLYCIEHIHTESFMLEDIYRFEAFLKERYPNNANVRPKIRQQLQVLRDKGFIEFLGNGHYRKL